MKKISKLIFACLCVFIITGCGASRTEVINPNKLITIAKNDGFPLIEAKNDYDYAKYAYSYKTDTTDILYIEVDEGTLAAGLYIDNVNNVSSEAGEGARTSTDKGDDYSVFTASNNGKFYIASRVGKSFIIAKTNLGGKDRLIKFLKDINYY